MNNLENKKLLMWHIYVSIYQIQIWYSIIERESPSMFAVIYILDRINDVSLDPR